MLVISRRIGESFLIGDDIMATVVDITGEKVVLGIAAPRKTPINRSEVLAVTVENQSASSSGNINMNSFSRMYKKRFPQGPGDNR